MSSIGCDLEKSYRCEGCGRLYRHSGNLKRHVRYECGKPAQFECPICSRRFSQSCNMQRHYNTCHPSLAIQDKY